MTTPNWTNLETVHAQILRKQGKTWAEIGDVVDRSETAVRVHLKRKGGTPATEQKSPPQEGTTFEDSGNTGFTSSVSPTITSLEELLTFSKVDLAVWEVERYLVNKWEMGYVDGDGEANTKPLFQVKAWLKKRMLVNKTRSLIKEMLEQFRTEAPKRPPVFQYRSLKMDGHLLEISIFDLHLGKLCWGPECGEHYDAKISKETFGSALETLIARAEGFQVSRIVFPVGNDFFNVDNAAQTTTAGTPQDEDGRYQKSFVAGRKLMVDAILRLREIAPVDVVMVSGNHDTERIFYLGDALEGWLSKTPGVTVNNSPTQRKYYAFGKCLIGYTHGHNEPHKNLPLIMATEVPSLWAASKFREIHLGHWHHKKEIHFQPVGESNGIRVRIIPSLCPADAWHKMKGYDGLRAAEAFVWHPEHGNVGTFSVTP
jgi:hypothetical protein